MAANLYTEEQFDALGMQARARFVIVRPNGALPPRKLPLASWCAIYCVCGPRPQSRPAARQRRAAAVRATASAACSWMPPTGPLRQPFTHGHHLWRPIPGEMAVFPGLDPARSGPESRRSRPDAGACPRPLRRSPGEGQGAAAMVSPFADDPAHLVRRTPRRRALSDRPRAAQPGAGDAVPGPRDRRVPQSDPEPHAPGGDLREPLQPLQWPEPCVRSCGSSC